MAVWLMQVLLQDIVVGSSDPKVQLTNANLHFLEVSRSAYSYHLEEIGVAEASANQL